MFSKFLENKPLFNNRTSLSISFSPESIPHRDKQIADLGRILAPALKGGRPSNVFIYGRTGTGKTCVSRLVCEELQKTCQANGKDLKVIYMNCKMKKSADTEYRLMASLSKEFGKEVPFTGLPTDQIYNIFFNTIDEKEQTIILILDEIDSLVKKTGDEILYNLTRINQDLKKAKVSIIGITNDLGFVEKLDPRVKSSLSEEELIFPPYNALQLQDILRDRARIAFSEESIGAGVIEKCAALAAQEHGDARRALDLLRVAAELAERSADSKITVNNVDSAEDKIDVDRIIETVKSQPKQSQAVLWALMKLNEKDNANIQTGEAIDEYRKTCNEHGLKALTQRRVSDLISELDMFGIINMKVISKGRYGRTRVITIDLADDVYKKLNAVLLQTFT